MNFRAIEIRDNKLFKNRQQPDLVLAPTTVHGAVARLTLYSLYAPQVSFYLSEEKLAEVYAALGTLLGEI